MEVQDEFEALAMSHKEFLVRVEAAIEAVDGMQAYLSCYLDISGKIAQELRTFITK